jgi:ankyrin repeat protein
MYGVLLFMGIFSMSCTTHTESTHGHSVYSALCNAFKHGYLNIVKELIHHYNNINQPDAYGKTLLHKASCHRHTGNDKHIAIIKELIKYGADVNAQDKNGSTPLYYACIHKNAMVLTELISAGAHINTKILSGYTPLHIACFHGNTPIVTELLKAGAHVNAQNIYSLTPLYIASFKNYPDVVKELIKYGAHVNQSDEYERTPLHIACNNKNSTIIKELVSHKAELRYIGKDTHPIRFLLHTCDDLNNMPIVSDALDYARQEDFSDPLIHNKSTEHASLAYIMAFKGAHTPRLHTSLFSDNITGFKHIDTQYPRGSVSYAILSEHIKPPFHHIYIAKLCIDGHYISAFRIIREKALSEGITQCHDIRAYIINYIFTFVARFAILTPIRMKQFAYELYSYNKTRFDKNELYMSSLINNLNHIKDDSSIHAFLYTSDMNINATSSADTSLVKKAEQTLSLVEHIQRLVQHVTPSFRLFDYSGVNETDKIQTHIHLQNGVSILEKAILLNRKKCVKTLMQSEHINIDALYAFLTTCKNKGISCADLTHRFGIPQPYTYAQMMYNLKHTRDMLNQLLRQKYRKNIYSEPLARYISSFTDTTSSLR